MPAPRVCLHPTASTWRFPELRRPAASRGLIPHPSPPCTLPGPTAPSPTSFSREHFQDHFHTNAHARLSFWEPRLTREPHKRCFFHKHSLDYPKGICSKSQRLGSRPHESRLEGGWWAATCSPHLWEMGMVFRTFPSNDRPQVSHTHHLSACQFWRGLFVLSRWAFFLLRFQHAYGSLLHGDGLAGV